ncbi:MAG: DNA polymerase I [Acidimicrobiia bacterium]|nr:DNA polymerase I [Acidimicrobiia bacterium]
MPKLALLDGHSLAYRAFYALPSDLATPAGQVTNAVYGFTSMLIKLLGDESPDAIAVAWDLRGPTFRSERYSEYKAQRESPPDLFASQLPLIREVLDVMQINQLSVPGFEADDVIATLATQAKKEGWETVVVTGDRDAFQLSEAAITVLYTRRGISDTVEATPAWIQERYGVAPEKYVEYAALRGDTSDNLPGVPGVGEKTAAKLLANYGSLEGIFQHLDEQSPKLRENLEASEEQVLLNRELMRLVTDVQFPEVTGGKVELDAFTLREWQFDDVRRVFDGLAFRSLWDRLMELEGEETGAASGETIDVEVLSGDGQDLADALKADLVAIDPVWTGGELVGVTVATSDSTARFLPPDQATQSLANCNIVAHDAKTMLRALAGADLDLPNVGFDTALAAYLINPAQRTPTLEELAYKELGLALEEQGEEDGNDASQAAFDFDGAAEAGPDLGASGRRAIATARLIEPLRAQLDARGSVELMETIELPMVPLLAQMEATGVAVDRAFLEKFGDNLRRRLGVLEQDIHEAAGGNFNINSTLQLREVLFERLDLPILKKTPKGVPSTDASVLQKLRTEHAVVDKLLEYRELEKLRSTYVDALLPLIEGDGRVRGKFNQMAAATGRLSQEQPNLQNIPIRSEEGRAIRQAFVAEEGNTLLVADYSQIELRILAHLSEDPGLVGAFANDMDIHTATAARINDVAIGDVTSEQRRRAKMVNFGLLYGMEAYGLAQRLEISRDEAQVQIDAYFSQFEDVRDFMKGIVAEARATGYTTTILGRRRYLPELASSNFRDRQMGERMALNAPIQGAAADIIKKAMVQLDRELRSRRLGAEMLLQIHDELVLEVSDGDLDEVEALTKSVMENVIELKVPLKVETARGKSLADTKS